MQRWIRVCGYEELLPDRPVAALVGDQQVAVVRLADGSVHALDNRDPFSRAQVLARGIVGDRDGVAILVSPMHKQAFDLGTGICVDDDGVAVAVHHVRLRAGQVDIAIRDPHTRLLDAANLGDVMALASA